MTTEANIDEILSRPSAEIKSKPPKPVGTYHCMVQGPFEIKTVGQKQTTVHDYTYKILAPMEDVDAQQAAEQGVVGQTIRDRFFITEAAVFMLKEALVDAMGIDDNNGQKSLKEMESEAPGKQLLVTLKHRSSEDGKRVFEEVASRAHV